MPMDPGDRACRWISNLVLTDDYAGQPFILLPYQDEFIRTLFGTFREDGLRRYRKALLLLGRKQGKSQLAAGLATYCLLGEGKSGQYIAVAAGSRDQASHLFDKIVAMIEADPYLRKQVQIYSSRKRIETKKNGNVVQVLSAEGRLQLGANISTLLFDELLAQPDRRLYDALTSGSSTRREPLTILISTQGNRRDSLIWQEYEYACKVRDGVIDDPTYLPVIYEVPPDADWMDETVWPLAMPALGHFCHLEFFRAELAKAKEVPSEEAKFRSFYLNQLVASESKWLNRAKWDECGKTRFDEAELIGRPCYVGLDLSATSDITAMVMVFPWHDGTYRILCHFWIPENYARLRDRKGHTKYGHWHKRGFIEFTPGDEIDYPGIEEAIPKLLAPYKVKQILCDPYNATGVIQKLTAARLPVLKHRQGWQSMSDPIKYTEVLISKGQLHHNDNPVLNWMADNVVVHRDRLDNLTFDKGNSADKIDGLVSLVMGIAGANAASRITNVYATRKPEILTSK